MSIVLNKKINKLPDAPGVYFFLNRQKKPIYIGKATSLRDRVKSYFGKDLHVSRGPLLVKMTEEAYSIDYTPTPSVLEALLLEADLIKKFKPIYNTKEKDDKSFLCVALTSEDFPQILLERKKDIDSPQSKSYKLQAVFGPYTSGLQLKEALKIIRRIFPYRDNKCFPKGHPRNKNGRPCFSRQIGLCPGVCTGEVSKKEYVRTIKNLKLFLSGKTKKLISIMQKDMHCFAKDKKFEEAGKIKNQVYAIQHINDISLIKSDPLNTKYGIENTQFRIEAYDIAHMAGKNIVGGMIVLHDGLPQTNDYRKFIIRSVTDSNDPASLFEIISRRLTHSEWQTPDLIVVDGGEVQLKVAKKAVENAGLKIPVVSVVKNERHKAKAILGDDLAQKYKKEIVFANAECHRYTITFHKQKRQNSFIDKGF